VMQASPCADTLPPLLALESVLTLCSARGTRLVPLNEAILAPYQTVLQEDEILTAISFTALADRAASAYCKLGRRNALSISRMSVAVVLSRESNGRLSDVRIAAGSVAPSPRRFPEVERLLLDQVPSDALIEAAGAELAAAMIRITGRRWSTPYKEPVVAALTRRALRRALERR
jgi:CO/xanthine dehydrogenase FAD-binding subunit